MMDTEENKKEEPEVVQMPEQEKEKETNNSGDVVDEKNASEETLKGIQSTLSRMEGGIESLSKMSSQIESLQSKISELEKKVEESKPVRELHAAKIEGYYDYDAINRRYINEAANTERAKAFEIINNLGSNVLY